MKYTYIHCPNCKSKIRCFVENNRWVKWVKINCETCGYYYLLKEEDLDILQPNSPLFELVYGKEPTNKLIEDKKSYEEKKEKQKEIREKNLWKKVKDGKLKTTELKEVKFYTKDRGIE